MVRRHYRFSFSNRDLDKILSEKGVNLERRELNFYGGRFLAFDVLYRGIPEQRQGIPEYIKTSVATDHLLIRGVERAGLSFAPDVIPDHIFSVDGGIVFMRPDYDIFSWRYYGMNLFGNNELAVKKVLGAINDYAHSFVTPDLPNILMQEIDRRRREEKLARS